VFDWEVFWATLTLEDEAGSSETQNRMQAVQEAKSEGRMTSIT
jgi:hypothetical protein